MANHQLQPLSTYSFGHACEQLGPLHGRCRPGVYDVDRLACHNGLLVGQLRKQQQSSYDATSLSGPLVLYGSAAAVPTTTGTQGYFTNLMQGQGDGAGSVTIQASVKNQNGQAGPSSNTTYPVTTNPNGRFAIETTWLYMYDNNQAILLDSGSNQGSQNVGLGWLENQSAVIPLTTATECSAPGPSVARRRTCTEANVPFPYFTGSLPSFDASMSSESGVLTLDGYGNISLTQDWLARA